MRRIRVRVVAPDGASVELARRVPGHDDDAAAIEQALADLERLRRAVASGTVERPPEEGEG